MKIRFLLLVFTLFISLISSAAVTIKEAKGWLESGYVTWDLVDGASTYHVYCKAVNGTYTRLDAGLVRNYGTYGRADVIGIASGSYLFKVVPVDAEGIEMIDQASESAVFAVKAHDRSGFAHFNYSGVGAYNDNGTLKEGAQVIYVTAKTASTVKCSVAGTECVGLQSIMDAREKGKDVTPLCVRIVGKIELADMDHITSSAEGLQIKGKSSYSDMNITLEGIGNDAVIRGFGILLRNCKSVELRNFAIMLCLDDCVSFDTHNSNCWVHHIDFFYGKTGSASDQAKGDGTLDLKDDSKYLSFSYNHFWDSGKSSLCGMKSETGENFITYHHNWFDHSDSRHPRVRTMTVHVYNNYYDGVAKYGVGATTRSNVFVESNYFRNTNKPMLIALQGTDTIGGKTTFSGETGGMIKAYGNYYAAKSSNFKLVTHKQSSISFDCYEAATADEVVPNTYVTLSEGTPYNNFDTDKTKMYQYVADEAENVPGIVKGEFGAGRMQHGDFEWKFNDATDDASYAVDGPLKTAISNYTSTLVGIFGDDSESGGGEPDPEDPVVPQPDGYECFFTDGKVSNSFYSITGNFSNSKGTATVNGTEYKWCLKLESATSVKFTIDKEMVLTLVFASGSTPNIKIDGTKVNSTSDNIITYTLATGLHEITKADSNNLFYINLAATGATGIEHAESDSLNEEGDIYDISGRVVRNPQKGIYIKNGKKFYIQ